MLAFAGSLFVLLVYVYSFRDSAGTFSDDIMLKKEGKRVLTATSKTIDISSLVPGVYLVEIVSTNNSSQKRKIIKE